MKQGRFLEAEKATWEEARAFLKTFPAAILPLGATEQHGPHLPQGTDTEIARAIARRTAERVGGYLLPPLPITYSWTWKNFAGTPWLSHRTLMDCVKEIARSLSEQGVRALLMLTGHAANQGPLKYAVRELKDEACPIAVLYGGLFGWGEVAQEVEAPVWRTPYEVHAEEIETSLMLAIDPTAVHISRAVAEYPQGPRDLGHSQVSMGDITCTGVFGDATRASAEKGRRWLDHLARRTAEVWGAFLREHGILDEGKDTGP